jgi:hypothetical protein
MYYYRLQLNWVFLKKWMNYKCTVACLCHSSYEAFNKLNVPLQQIRKNVHLALEQHEFPTAVLSAELLNFQACLY